MISIKSKSKSINQINQQGILQYLESFMISTVPKTLDLSSSKLQVFDILSDLIKSAHLRIQAEDLYEKSLIKSVQKINQIQTSLSPYSLIIKHFKALSTQRIFQIKFFKEQVQKQVQILENTITSIEKQFKQEVNKAKTLEREMKTMLEDLYTEKKAIQKKMEESDEKIILNQLAYLNKANKVYKTNAQKLIKQQQQSCKEFTQNLVEFKEQVKQYKQALIQKQKCMGQFDNKIALQFIDYLKKFNVHQISLIRNIQYDIDSMIKKTDLFNWQNLPQNQSQVNLGQLQKLELKIQNIYHPFKLQLIDGKESSQKICQKKQNQELVNDKQLKELLESQDNYKKILKKIKQNLPLYRQNLILFIESYRKQNVFKFQTDKFKHLTKLFKEFLRLAFSQNDFDFIQKIILYSSTYAAETKSKKSIFDHLKDEPFLSEIGFWRFLLFASIKRSVQKCYNYEEQKQLHIKNAVYSTLLSNSLTIIGCGIQKYQVKNLIGKMAKGYGGLSDVKVNELLKFVQSGFQTYEKNKEKEKQLKKQLKKQK